MKPTSLTQLHAKCNNGNNGNSMININNSNRKHSNNNDGNKIQDLPSTLNWGYMVPNSGYLGPNRG